ncbi:hypothetical protein D3C83_19360 [compost metagenome]
MIGEHTIEAVSMRVRSDLAHRGELWDRCYRDLMTRAVKRLEQEMARLGGDCVHVLEESVDTRRDDATGEAWLHGRFSYLLLRVPTDASRQARPPGGAVADAKREARRAPSFNYD